MDRSIEERYAIKFCFRLGKTASETFAMITEAYKEHALSRAQVFRWFNEFKNGRESVEDVERSGRPSTSRVDESVDKLKELLDSDRRLSLKMIADEVSMNKFTVLKAVKRKRQDLAHRWRLHHDNSQAHTAFL
ncbi:protein GVQW3-like, partial [Homalodisca vitripennis]|uniref:protein GVQW3-like n=1 Tax=Homalodisca vitripennis TaxID=197043 RepID=UPI001EEA905F